MAFPCADAPPGDEALAVPPGADALALACPPGAEALALPLDELVDPDGPDDEELELDADADPPPGPPALALELALELAAFADAVAARTIARTRAAWLQTIAKELPHRESMTAAPAFKSAQL